MRTKEIILIAICVLLFGAKPPEYYRGYSAAVVAETVKPVQPTADPNSKIPSPSKPTPAITTDIEQLKKDVLELQKWAQKLTDYLGKRTPKPQPVQQPVQQCGPDCKCERETPQEPKDTYLIFTATWCPPCMALHNWLDKNKELASKYTIEWVNVDQDPQTTKMFGVNQIPVVVQMRDSREQTRLNAKEFEKKIQEGK